MVLPALLACGIAYLLGSVLPAEWLARRRGVDIRTIGDGNPGMTNAFRGLGVGPGLIAAAYDMSVGIVSILIARALGAPEGAAYLAGIASLVGHRFPVFSGFRGGQGMADSVGMLLFGIGVGLSAGWLSAVEIAVLAAIGLLTFVLTSSDRAVAIVTLPLLAGVLAAARPSWAYLAFMVVVVGNIWVVQVVAVRNGDGTFAFRPLRH